MRLQNNELEPNTVAGERLEIEMDSERVVELFCKLESERTNDLTEALDCNGTDLLGLRLGIDIESGLLGWQQNLERVDAAGVGRYRHDR